MVTLQLMQDQLLLFLTQTGLVSPPFHMVYDDHFTTVPFTKKNEILPHWANLVENLHEKVSEEHYELAKM